MRLLIIALMLASMAFAQTSPDEEINQCMKGCCQKSGGEWDEGGGCQINETDSQAEALSNCQLQCIYGTAGVDTGLGACFCAPAVILMVVVGAALKRTNG